MTGRTHDLAGLTTLVMVIGTQNLPVMSLGTAISAFVATTIGALLPDIDDASADVWDKIPIGSLTGKIISPLMGHHRMISHSIVGMAIAGWLTRKLLEICSSFLIVDINIVWGALMLGYASHLIMDSLTREGVPWLFPIPIRWGFPPVKWLRITTGKWGEKLLVFPGLVVVNAYFIYLNYDKFVNFFTKHIIH